MKNRKCLYCKNYFKPRNINQKLCSDCLKKKVYYCCDECGKKFLLNKNQLRDYLMGVDRKYYCSNHCVRKNQQYRCKCKNCDSIFLSNSNTSLLCPNCKKIIIKVPCSFCGKIICLSLKQSNKELINPNNKNYFCNNSCSTKFLFQENPELKQQARERIINYNKSELGRLNSSKVGEQTGSNNIKKAHLNDGYRFCNKCKKLTYHLIGVGCLNCHNKQHNYKSFCKNCGTETTHIKGLGCLKCFNYSNNKIIYCNKCKSYTFHAQGLLCMKCHNKQHNYKSFCKNCGTETMHAKGLGCLVCHCNNTEMFMNPNTGSRGIRTKLIFSDKEIVTRSSWETIFALFLFYNHFDFSYESLKINYTDFDGKNRIYYPDFIIGNDIVEVKGWVNDDFIKLIPIYESVIKELGYSYSVITDISFFRDWLFINNYGDLLKFVLNKSKFAKKCGKIFVFKL